VIAGVGWATPIHSSRAIGRRPTLVAGGGLFAAFLLVALAAPLLAPYDPIAQNLPMRLQPPSLLHLLGTDFFGRDVLSRVIWGARVDVQLAIFGVAFPFVAGTLVGTVAGYLGGIVDKLVMRLVDVVVAFPFLVLMLAVLAVLGPGLSSFYIAIALVGWVSYARMVRAQILVLKTADYAVAAASLGFGRARIMLHHLLPNALVGPVVFAMSDATLALVAGASIGYLGLGVQPPLAEWGVMVAEGQAFLGTAWWIVLGPGLAIVALALAFSLLGDGLADLLGSNE
jgi:peptide/nickel transport system permease protein